VTGNDVLYWTLRAAGAVLPRTPVAFAHRLAALAGRLAFALFPGPRNAVLANLAVVRGTTPDNPALKPLAIQAFVTDATNWVDTLRIGRTPPEIVVTSVDVDHFERLEEAAAAGKGVVIVTMHLGNYDLVGQYLMAKGFRLTIPVERMEPPRLFDYLCRLRGANGIKLVPLDHAPREMIRALRAGEVVGVAGDRTVAGIGGIPVEFFGRPALLPHGPVSLARRTGAPLLIGVGIRVDHDRFVGHVVGPVPMIRSADAHADDRENLRRVAGEMECLVARYPGQWLQFSRLWLDDAGPQAVDTMSQHSEAAV
jgi:phosphatidylinositol dimannoside acyltransferase